MIEIHQNGIKGTDSDTFKEFEDITSKEFEDFIDSLEEHLSLAESDLEFVENKMKKKFPSDYAKMKLG